MKQRIIDELKRIEQSYGVKIVYAVESGSRAWGFPSQDSDYDVRFIYVPKKSGIFQLSRSVMSLRNRFTICWISAAGS